MLASFIFAAFGSIFFSHASQKKLLPPCAVQGYYPCINIVLLIRMPKNDYYFVRRRAKIWGWQLNLAAARKPSLRVLRSEHWMWRAAHTSNNQIYSCNSSRMPSLAGTGIVFTNRREWKKKIQKRRKRMRKKNFWASDWKWNSFRLLIMPIASGWWFGRRSSYVVRCFSANGQQCWLLISSFECRTGRHSAQHDGRHAGDANDNNNLLHQIFTSFSKTASARIFHSRMEFFIRCLGMCGGSESECECDCNENVISNHKAIVPR